jgi:hypothetical protein
MVEGLGPMTCNAFRFGLSTILLILALPWLPTQDLKSEDSSDDDTDSDPNTPSNPNHSPTHHLSNPNNNGATYIYDVDEADAGKRNAEGRKYSDDKYEKGEKNSNDANMNVLYKLIGPLADVAQSIGTNLKFDVVFGECV